MQIGVIFATFQGAGKAPLLRESFMNLHKACQKIHYFEIFNGAFPPVDFVSSNVELTSSTVTCSSFTGAIFLGAASREKF